MCLFTSGYFSIYDDEYERVYYDDDHNHHALHDHHHHGQGGVQTAG